MADNARGIHVSPGIYSREVELNYAVKSLGITTLGLVGETQRGPAFQPMSIENWRDFQDTFGGTSTEKFAGSQYPKYEAPYIAKSYLSESNQLEVCRVLGLSGYNAGPAWLITAPYGSSSSTPMVVAVLRSRAYYQKYVAHQIRTTGDCACGTSEYDRLTYRVGDIDFGTQTAFCLYPKHSFGDALQLKQYTPFASDNPCTGGSISSGDELSFDVSSTDYGHFRLVGIDGQIDANDILTKDKAKALSDAISSGATGWVYQSEYFDYSLSLNPSDKDYIINVLGTDPSNGEAPIYVESLYDVAYQQQVNDGNISQINSGLTFYDNYNIKDFCQLKPVDDLLTIKEEALSRKYVGKRYLAQSDGLTTCHKYDYSKGKVEGDNSGTTSAGTIYTVRQFTDAKHTRHYYYTEVDENTIKGKEFSAYTTSGVSYNIACDKLLAQGTDSLNVTSDNRAVALVYNKADNSYYRKANSTQYLCLLNNTTYSAKTDAQAVIDAAATDAYFGTIKVGNTIVVTVSGTTDADVKSKINNKITVTPGRTEPDDNAHTTHVFSPKVTVDGKYTLYYTSDNPVAYKSWKDESGVTQYSADTQGVEDMLEKLRVDANNAIERSKNCKAYIVVNNVMYTSLDSAYNSLIKEDGEGSVHKVTSDLNNYKSAYRYASTPWIVSNLKGDYNSAELHKLFRFHTISDGDSSNNEIKVSIANIRPDAGTFDVIVRKIGDTDASMSKLESFSQCNLIPGSDHYIGYLIGTYNGDYEVKSKYITVEVNETLTTKASAPAGFLGYPLPRYNGTQIFDVTKNSDNALTINKNTTEDTANIIVPRIAYNTLFDEDVKHKRQYFGLSDISGVDVDLFTYKGVTAYPQYEDEEPSYFTPGFHLDARVGELISQGNNLTVEGISGFTFDTVSMESTTDMYEGIPLIATEEEMSDCIYSYVDLRKFTVYFYGGFDGWDAYRDARTNTNDYKLSNYKGEYSKTSGIGYAFDRIDNPSLYKINDNNAITSDYYAYLSAIRQFANPEEIDINVLATPGIDLINNSLLAEEVIDMVEEERADSIYVATLPDKPYGASDYTDEMYTPDDIVDELEDTEIDSNYTCVYYPWVKYYDADNYQYINLPVTKDVVRNMALTDNTTQPWFAPAGISRGDVSCEHAHYITSLADEDVLYEGRVNPVKSFASDGVKLWGQKNLQVADSQLNRIAVRRLLLRMRKLVAIACRTLIFEPNDSTTKASFLSTVTPIMDNIKSNRGISDYKIEVNDTAESRERRELPAKIYFKPYNALEYISLDFIVTPEGVDFDNI